MAQQCDVLIVGGGNLGLWTAYELARRGVRRIVVCERYWAGFGATSRSAGVVRQQGGSEAAVKLGKWSRERYLRLGEEIGLDSGFIQTGYVILATSAEEKETFLELVELRRRCGVENEWLDPDEGRRRFPDLCWEHFSGGTYTATDGNVHPPIAARNITLGVLRSGAVELHEQCEVQAIEMRSGSFQLRTTHGDFEAEKVVDAGGPRGARQVGQMLDVEVPVSAARHEIVTFPALRQGAAHPFPMYFVISRGVYWRPEEQGALLGMSNPEERPDTTGRYQIGFDWEYYERVRPEWERWFPPLLDQPISRAWAASIDYTPDHLPIVDQPMPGFYVLAGGGHGMMWGPGLGKTMAGLVVEDRIEDLPEDEVRLARFSAPRRQRDAIALPFPTE